MQEEDEQMNTEYVYIRFPDPVVFVKYVNDFIEINQRLGQVVIENISEGSQGTMLVSYFFRFTMKDDKDKELLICDQPFYRGMADERNTAEGQKKIDAAKLKMLEWINNEVVAKFKNPIEVFEGEFSIEA